MGFNSTRSVGTVLMCVGLVMILSVGGYFAWAEAQAAQVRSELEKSSAAAAIRATRMAKELSPSALSLGATPTRSAASAVAAPEAKGSPSPSAGRALSARASTPPARRTATSIPTESPTASASPAAPTETPTSEPTATPAPVLPVRLSIPALKIDAPVAEMGWNVVQTKNGPVSEWALPKNGAGHHVNSAAIGQPDNLVISGHNNIYGRVFMAISQAWNNDRRTKVDNYTDKSNALDGQEVRLFDAAGKQHTYVITEFYRLKDTGVSQQQRVLNGRFMQPTGEEQLTLITCWPPTNNTHRLVVIARPEK